MPYARKIKTTNEQGETTGSTTRYYLDRSIPGLGRVARSLDTTRKVVAQDREKLLVELAERGRLDLVESWYEGRVTIQKLQLAKTRNELGELTQELGDSGGTTVTIGGAIDRALEVKRGEVGRAKTIAGYRRTLEDFAAWNAFDLKQAEEDSAESTSRDRRSGSPAKHRKRMNAPWDSETCRDKGLGLPVGKTVSDDRTKRYLGARRGLGRSERTIHNDKTALSVLGAYCEEKGWIDSAPNFKWTRHKPRIRWLPFEEATAYLAEAEPGEERDLMAVLITTGIRLGEAEVLTPANLRFAEDPDRGFWIEIRDSKTEDGVRWAFGPGSLGRRLQTRIEAEELGPADRLFTIPRRTIQKHHRRTCERLGIRPNLDGKEQASGRNTGYTIHDHRHTAAVHLAKNGMPLQQIKEQLGHGTIEQTMIYARFHPDYTDLAPYFDQVADQLDLENVVLPTASDGSEASEAA